MRLIETLWLFSRLQHMARITIKYFPHFSLPFLLELCRRNSSSCTSVEDLAMHRVLAERVHRSFVGEEMTGVQGLLSEMVSAAVEASLAT